MQKSNLNVSKELARAWMGWAFFVLGGAALLTAGWVVSWDSVWHGLLGVVGWALKNLVAFEIWSSQNYVWLSIYVVLVFWVKFELGRSMTVLVPEALGWLAGQQISEAALGKARQHQRRANLVELAQGVWLIVSIVGLLISWVAKNAAGLEVSTTQTLLHAGIFLFCMVIGFKRTRLVLPASLSAGEALDFSMLNGLVYVHGCVDAPQPSNRPVPLGDWFYHDSLLALLAKHKPVTTVVAEAKDYLDKTLYEAWTMERAHG